MTVNTVHDDLGNKIRWLRFRAEDVRTEVEGMHHDVSRRSMLDIAETYENIAETYENIAETYENIAETYARVATTTWRL